MQECREDDDVLCCYFFQMIEDSALLEGVGLELLVGNKNKIFRRKETDQKKIFKVHYGKSPCVLFLYDRRY